jgi:hypothetical protein
MKILGTKFFWVHGYSKPELFKDTCVWGYLTAHGETLK